MTTPKNKTPNNPKVKKSSQRGLGRGLSALMSDMSALETTSPIKPEQKKSAETAQSQPSEAGVNFVNIALIDRNPAQPRKYFDKDKLEELTQSIKDKGVLQPILVRPITSAGKHKTYQIVAGERRWQAALKAGLDALPVLIRELSDQDVLEIGVVENVQRANLNPIEEAAAYQALKTEFGRTQDDIARAIGKSRPYIANMMRLLSLPERAQSYLAQGKISAGHARAIISSPDPVELADVIAEKGLSVREAEDWVRRIKAASENGAAPKPRLVKSADTRKAEQDLMDILGLGVDLRHKGPSGELRIRYKNSAQLDNLMKRLSRSP
ncbi:MAG: ParB/RepB/Spo0J family partition protein [Litorimonas sp.]